MCCSTTTRFLTNQLILMATHSQYEQLCNFTAAYKKGVSARYFRSKEPVFSQISKQDDAARYNTLANNVYFYKNYPNQMGTPIKSSRKCTGKTFKRNVSPKEHFTKELLRKTVRNEEIPRSLYAAALRAELRDSGHPTFRTYQSAKTTYVFNDFHRKETNQGFARNGSGGFYAR